MADPLKSVIVGTAGADPSAIDVRDASGNGPADRLMHHVVVGHSAVAVVGPVGTS